MPRTGRVIARNMPHHIVQRGHNRDVVFVEEADYLYYLNSLLEWKTVYGVKLYCWCLMTNHVHLILDPGDDIKSIGLLMKRLAGRQTRFVNRQENRTGSLWDGRYKMSIIDSDRYFPSCCRYIERNPVKANMVHQPEHYQWSSYRENAAIVESTTIDREDFGLFWDVTPDAYRTFVSDPGCKENETFIRTQLERNQLTGSGKFVDEIERKTGIRVENRKPGRPGKPC